MTDRPAENLTLLFESAVLGDKSAETELFDYLGVRFRLFVKRRLWAQDDWEDIVQDALTTVSQKYKEVKPAEKLPGWAYRVLKNKLMNYMQAKSRREAIETRMPQNASFSIGGTPEHGTKRQLLKCLRQIWRVNVRYARILNLHHLGYSTEEVCRKLELRPEVYYSVLSRARGKLKQCLEKGSLEK